MSYKICFITTVSYTLKAFILDTAKYIHGHTDWEITFICNPDNDFKKELPDYIHYIPVEMERGISISGIKSFIQILKVFHKEKFDMIQYSTPNASLYAAMAGALERIPVRLYCQWGIVYSAYSDIYRKFLKAAEKLICNLSTWIEPDSYSNLYFAHREKLYGKEKSSVVWNGSATGVNLEKFDYSKKNNIRANIRRMLCIPESSYVYGFVGRITRDKGINELLQAFYRIQKECDNVYLVIVGTFDPSPHLNETLLRWSKKQNNILYTGWGEKIEEYLSCMDCFVLPSYREGFGLVIIEAEAMGLPVIVTDIPGPSDAISVDKTAISVKPKNVRELASAMIRLYLDRNLGNFFGENGVRLIREKFDQRIFLRYLLADRKRLLKNAGIKKKK